MYHHKIIAVGGCVSRRVFVNKIVAPRIFSSRESNVAVPPRTVHRPSIAFLTIAGVMFAVAHATAHEMAGDRPSVLASGLSRSGFGAASSERVGLDNRGLVTVDRPVGPGDARYCPSPACDQVVSPHGHVAQPGSQSRHRVQAGCPVRVASGTLTHGARPDGGSILRPGKRSHRRCWTADDWNDCVDGDDDDASVPVDAWFREMVRGLCHVIPAEGNCRSAGTDPLSARFPTLERLRC